MMIDLTKEEVEEIIYCLQNTVTTTNPKLAERLEGFLK